MKLTACCLLTLWTVAVSTAQADIILTLGDVRLQPNSALQQVAIPLTVTSNNLLADQVTGFNLRAQIGDGIGGDAEPVFSMIVFSDTIWDFYPTTVLGGPVDGFEQFAQASVVFNTSGHRVAAHGTVAYLFVDTTGFDQGTFEVSLFATQIGADSEFIGLGDEVSTTIRSGSITVVPEPSGLVFGLIGLTGVLRRRGRVTAQS